jgi:hypothetical protein
MANDLAVAVEAPLLGERKRTGLKSWAAAFFLCGIRPATLALRTLHISLRGAAAVHFLSAIIAIVSVIAIIAKIEGQPLGTVWAQIIREIGQYPETAFLAITGFALLIEVGFVVLAFVFMSWGAVDEPLRGSFSHALRRAWCQSPHVTLCIILIGLFVWRLDALSDAWAAAHPVDYPREPDPPPGMQPNTPESDAYDQLVQAHWNEYSRIWTAAQAAKPWYLRLDEPIAIAFGFVCGLWFLTALLRAVGVQRPSSPVLRPPCCDACGYDLTTLPPDSRCPECGEPVAASLGPDARPGTPWQRQTGVATWWTCSRLAIFRPAQLGRMLQLQTPGTAHRRFLFIHLPFILLIGASSFPALQLALSWAGLVSHPPWPAILLVGTVFGICCTVAVLIVSLTTASCCSVLYHIRDRRNLLPGAVQVASYLVPLLVLWQAVGAVTTIGAIVLGNAPTFISKVSSRADPALLAFLLWLVPNLFCLLTYWRRSQTAVAATRYANR